MNKRNNQIIYLMIDATMSRIAHKWIIKIGQVGGSSKRKTSARLTDYNEKTAISTKDWVEFFSFEIHDLNGFALKKIEEFVREHLLWNDGGISETELVVFRGSIYHIQDNCEKILNYLKTDKGLKILPKRTFKSGGTEMENLKGISKEIEKRLKLKDKIDALIGKLKKQPKKKLDSDLVELIRLKDKQYKLEL